ncbi:MAG TPA: nucleotidyltransferase family protein [Sphingomonas sp.]|nr:nucleotidyltransferase family protein [Sphingomonas sp.]
MRVAILLAAGESRRFGPGNKLLARIGRETVLARVLGVIAQAPVQRLIVVTGDRAPLIAAEVRRHAPHARIVRARDYREGMGASLRVAARALRPVDREALLFLGDMPWLPPGLAARLIRAGRNGEAVRPRWRGVPGHPVLLRGAALDALEEARGDEGLRARGLAVRFLPADEGCIADIDTRRALLQARSSGSGKPRPRGE